MTVTVRNIITSMRLMSAFGWEDFFESVSMVDEILGNGSNFAEMDFATRDYYRHAVEDLSRGSSHTEIDVARRAIDRAKHARAEFHTDGQPQRGPQGGSRLLLDLAGSARFRTRTRISASPGDAVCCASTCARPFRAIWAPSPCLTAIILALPLTHAHSFGVRTPYLVLLGLLASVPASDLAIALINRAVTDLLGPRTLPRLELRDGVPSELRTIIVVPTLLTSVHAIKELVERLEIHYLANPEGDLRFALLTDWVDAPTESLPQDEELLNAAINGIANLNAAHGHAPGGGNRFFLFHRQRVWNERERKWMGWERKRGKLHELNQLLRGATNTTFLPIAGVPPQAIPGVRYVITLDADTRLSRGTAARLVGTMAHALNRPKFSEALGRVVDGYGVVQPRITPSLPSDREGSLFQRIFSGPTGIDPYAAAVSDVYQDLFHEGSYTGKGIYDLDAFEAALAGKVKENTLAQPRFVRRHFRTRRAGHGHRALRRISLALRSGRRPPASLGAR